VEQLIPYLVAAIYGPPVVVYGMAAVIFVPFALWILVQHKRGKTPAPVDGEF
jgi:hypothetical protein